jgi:hypothetical protein
MQLWGFTSGTSTKFHPPETDDIIEDGEVLGIIANDQLMLRALRIKNNYLQKQKEIIAAKRQCITMQAKVRQLILDEEQKAKELEQQSTDTQSEGHHELQQYPLHIPVLTPATFQGLNYLDERSPLAPQLQASPWPNNFMVSTYPSTTAAPTQHSTSWATKLWLHHPEETTPPWPNPSL